TGLHCINDGICDGKDRGMGAPGDEIAAGEVLWGFATLCVLNQGREVLLSVRRRADVLYPRKPDGTRGVDPIAVGVLRRHKAVRGDQDRAVEPLKLLPL